MRNLNVYIEEHPASQQIIFTLRQNVSFFAAKVITHKHKSKPLLLLGQTREIFLEKLLMASKATDFL